MTYPQAYTLDNLVDILQSNDNCRDVSEDEIDRLLNIAEQHADSSALEDDHVHCLITTEWDSFAANEFGYHNDNINLFAIGTMNVSASMGRGATLFENTKVVQGGWLTTGDGRNKKVEMYVDEEFESASEGEMWIPKNAQEYICIVELKNELLYDDPSVAEAM